MLVKRKIQSDSTKVSNKVKFKILSRRDRQAVTRLIAEADDGSKNVIVESSEADDDDGLIDTFILSIEA